MSKKEKKAKNGVVVLDPKSCFTVTKVGNAESFAIAPKFKAECLSVGESVGTAFMSAKQRAAEKLKFALQLHATFGEYKRVTKEGFPMFVHSQIDATCPKTYGKVGTESRREITHHAVFTGLETLIKAASGALKLQAERKAKVKALIATGLTEAQATAELADPEKMAEHSKKEREDKSADSIAEFSRVMLSIEQNGLTENTIASVLVWAGRHEKNDKGALNKSGVAHQQGALKAIFAKRARVERNVTPSKATKK